MLPTWTALADALRRTDLLIEADPAPPTLTGLSSDSRSVQQGEMYLAVRGSQFDGHRFAADAVARGASALMVETRQALPVPQMVVRDGKRAANLLARTWYGDPGSRLTLAGVTGTNGKTTTTALIRHLLNGTGTAGSIGTLGAFDGSGNPVTSTAGSLTTPGPVDLQATLA
ncbi:MAG TPA: Mur ligase domain-containing protein, partial [Gemmatimonadales bacterium]|nr:Mur ligase domain-containing protein [Gemmatimonadales bacterium]